MPKWFKKLRQLFCFHHPQLKHTMNRAWLECDKCGKKDEERRGESHAPVAKVFRLFLF